jgi:hypothetical protein
MRVATWNLDRIARGLRLAESYDRAITDLRADVAVVTEPGVGFGDRHPDAVLAPEIRPNRGGPEAWVAIVGSSLDRVEVELPYERLAAAARLEVDGRSIVIYGSILPWLRARNDAPDVFGQDERSFQTIFTTALAAQVRDIEELRSRYPGDVVFWAGAFNHTLVGLSQSRAASHALAAEIDRCGLRPLNADAPHKRPGYFATDLICSSKDVVCSSVDDLVPGIDGRSLSHHRAYVADVHLPGGSRDTHATGTNGRHI